MDLPRIDQAQTSANGDAVRNAATRAGNSWTFRTIVLLSYLAILVVNASTLNFWDDEVSWSYYLVNYPAPEMWDLFYTGVVVDPPLFYWLANGWVKIVGGHVLLLRLMPIGFWVACVAGTYVAACVMAGRRVGWLTVAITIALPYHWMFPVSFRWYSMFACFAVWNFVFYLLIIRERSNNAALAWGWSVAYVITGSLMWYVNYVAPALFLAHLLLLLSDRQRLLRNAVRFGVMWVAIGVSFLPCIPFLLAIVGRAVGEMSYGALLPSLYVIVSGEFISPFDYWLSGPLLVLSCITIVLLVRERRHCWAPMVTFAVPIMLMYVTRTIHMKRMLVVTPFITLAIGLALYKYLTRPESRPAWLIALSFSVVMCTGAGALYNMVKREDWMSYRWIDPFEEVVRQTKNKNPSTLIITNSDSVFFYSKCERGLYFQRHVDYESSNTLVLPLDLQGKEAEVVLARLKSAMQVVYIHTAADGPLSVSGPRIDSFFQRAGLEVEETATFLPASPKYLAHHPFYRNAALSDLDKYRVVRFTYGSKK